MDNFFEIVLAGIFGEALFRKIVKKKIFVPLLFLLITIIVELLFMMLTVILSLLGIVKGKEQWISFGNFIHEFFVFHFIMVQPYALLFSIFIAMLGVLSYLWHRKYSHNEKE